MKQTISLMLLITTLWSGLAFAWDSHPEAAMGHGAALVLADDPADHPDNDLHHADHCCHGASHLTGIFNDFAMHLDAPHGAYQRPRAIALPSLYIPPFLKPPIV
ncbi:hypothetical protein Tel_06385 [Candidatus Tenderia electrophaga]|jgi:hypothetical protein|uniref:Cobalt transporter n=1 Tax=Candidatus Tenderia electrophaga TaxID=1748243 RepID=A0A0S2TCD7_9GAMM|nr:hypothetical protein Tel_06385 [Candidatus Tenderia electrophaga]